MMKRILVATALCLIGAVATASAQDEGANRESAMKKIGGSMAAMAAIAKGEKPYDAETVKASLTTISESIKAFPGYFPAGSEQASDESSPKIWEDKAGFEAAAAKLAGDADALLAQLPADQAAVGGALGTLGQDCAACHQTYRLKK